MKSRALIRTLCNVQLGRFLLFILLVPLHLTLSVAETPSSFLVQDAERDSLYRFIANHNSASDVLYVAHSESMQFTLDTRGLVMSPGGVGQPGVRMVFDGGLLGAELKGAVGDRDHVRIDSVRRLQVYDGIDVQYYFDSDLFEYDFIVAPDVDPGQVAVRFEGALGVALDARGGLLLYTDKGVIRHHPPYSYQVIGGLEKPVASKFILDGQTVRFELGAYDPGYELVIDPAVTYAGYFGDGSNTVAHDIATDADGNIYITGQSVVTTTVNGLAIEEQQHSIFIAKLDPFGAVLFSRYFGTQNSINDNYEQGRGIAVDAQGRIYVTGAIASNSGFRDDLNGYCNNGIADAFLVVYAPSNALQTDYYLEYSACLGGGGTDIGEALAVDEAGNVYIVGSTISGYQKIFPVTFGALRTGDKAYNNSEAFLMRLSPLQAGGYQLDYSTLIGGSGMDLGHAVALGDDLGVVYVAGSTNSVGLDAVTNQISGDYDGFVSKLRIQASGYAMLDYITYVGGEAGTASEFINSPFGVSLCGQWRSDEVCSLAVSTLGEVYAAGSHVSGSGYLSHINVAGQLKYSYAIGAGEGVNADAALGVSLDEVSGVLSVVGRVTGNTLGPEAVGVPSAGSDAFVSRYRVNGTYLYSLFIGGNGDDEARAVAVDKVNGDVYIAGVTRSENFPVFPSMVKSSLDAEAFALHITMDFDTARDVDEEFLGRTNNEPIIFILPDDGVPSVNNGPGALKRRSGFGGMGYGIVVLMLLWVVKKSYGSVAN